MYLSFFRLKEFPFNLTPDPRFLLMSRSHREAFDHLLFGIHQRRGFIEVVGGIGTGKTTLCRALLEELEGKVSTALIFNPFLSETELLRAINEEFGIDASGATRKALIDSLNGFLIEQLRKGGNACLVLDECQNLQVPVLEQIRLLSNLETENEKLLQIVMVGQSEFHEMLKSPPLAALDERIHVRAFLEPLTQEDTRAYIYHRLAVAGSKGDILFTDGALKDVYEYSQGIPRRINTVCDRCLLIAYTRETFRVTRDHARAAVAEIQAASLGPRGTTRSPSPPRRPYLAWSLRALAGVAMVSAGWGLSRLSFHDPAGPPPEPAPPVISVPLAAPPVDDAPQVAKVEPVPSPEEDPSSNSAPAPAPPPSPAPSIVSEDLSGSRDPSVAASPAPAADRLFAGLAALVPPRPNARVEDLARSMGMEAKRLTLSWGDIMRFQRPCLLEFSQGDGSAQAYGVLRGVSHDGVWIQGGDSGLRRFSKEELGRSWFGGVWVFLPAGRPWEALRSGARGGMVTRLQEKLARLGYWEGEPTGVYDEATRRWVMALQRDLHLPVDGRVGSQTGGMILQLLGDERGTP